MPVFAFVCVYRLVSTCSCPFRVSNFLKPNPESQTREPAKQAWKNGACNEPLQGGQLCQRDLTDHVGFPPHDTRPLIKQAELRSKKLRSIFSYEDFSKCLGRILTQKTDMSILNMALLSYNHTGRSYRPLAVGLDQKAGPLSPHRNGGTPPLKSDLRVGGYLFKG